MLKIKSLILTLCKFKTRREATANNEDVRIWSLSPNRLLATALSLLNANHRARQLH